MTEKAKPRPRSRKLSSIYQLKISLNTVLYFREENPKYMSYMIQVSCLPFYLSKKRSFFLQAYRKLNPFSLFSLLQNRHKNVKEFYNFIVFIILGAKMHQHGKILKII